MLSADQNFDVAQVIRFFRSKVRVKIKGDEASRNNSRSTDRATLNIGTCTHGDCSALYDGMFLCCSLES